jgi:hypothetical protein
LETGCKKSVYREKFFHFYENGKKRGFGGEIPRDQAKENLERDFQPGIIYGFLANVSKNIVFSEPEVKHVLTMRIF